MFRDLLEIVQEGLKKIITSRVFALAVMITFMFAMLIGKLFNLQIVHGEEALNQYISKTMKTV
ncbi:MAG: hypothetical protein RR590_08110 [Hungatella sp.]